MRRLRSDIPVASSLVTGSHPVAAINAIVAQFQADSDRILDNKQGAC